MSSGRNIIKVTINLKKGGGLMNKNLLPFETVKRKILVKKEAETDDKLGCRPKERKTEEIINYGVVNINKCQGPTSHQISDYVQKILGITKSGHSGTLE
tara:strand:+ start:5456 stop:5752 length:297 start_codon:yes stop_codon:yes gene_type:complete